MQTDHRTNGWISLHCRMEANNKHYIIRCVRPIRSGSGHRLIYHCIFYLKMLTGASRLPPTTEVYT